MRGLVRNKVDFYYAPYETKVEITDEYGNKTGEYELIYGKPVLCRGNISIGQGETQSRQFGDSVVYDKVILLCDTTIPIDEYSLLWIDTLPDIGADGLPNTPHDYIVKKVAKSLNVLSIAIKKVTVNA